MKKKFFGFLSIVMASSLLLAACGSQSSSGTGGGKNGKVGKHNWKIVLSNSYNGNSWRQEMVKSFKTAAKKAKQQGLIGSFQVVNANNTASQQVSQMKSLILKHPDAIVIDAASPTALNGVIQQANAAGIPIFSFDSVVSSPDAYKVKYDYKKMGIEEVNYVAKRLKGKGNLLILRGVAGSSVDQDFHAGFKKALKKYPNIKVVGQPFANWTETTAQSKVQSLIPSLPKVDAVIGEGGMEYGAIKAFGAAGRHVPIVTGGNRGYFLHWWKKQNGYKTVSLSSAPAVSSAALWLAIDVLNKKKAPKSVYMPAVKVTNANLDKAAASTGLKQVYSPPTYSQQWVAKNLLNQNGSK